MIKNILLMFTILFFISCSANSIEKGKVSFKSYSKNSYDESYKLAIDSIYSYIASYASKQIGRNDTNIIEYDIRKYYTLQESNLSVKNYKIFNKYATKISLYDTNLKNSIDNIAVSLTREGIAGNYMRSYASVDYPDNLTLYAKSVLERDALKRAKANLEKLFIESNIDRNKIPELLNEAYIVEETFKDKVYTVTIETVF